MTQKEEIKEKEYALVVDKAGNRLSPTPIGNAWYLIRKGRANMVSKYPMVIQLNKVIEEKDKSEFILGIDDGSKYVGIAIVQDCGTKVKPVLKGTIIQRQDVKKLMTDRRNYRQYHRLHKRYRPIRRNNRSSSKRRGRLTPSIKQKKESILRVINRLQKYLKIHRIVLEDSAFDIRALTDGYKPYKWQYKESNRLDENLRVATLMRDRYICQECGKKDCRLEAHHVMPRRVGGSDSIHNLITLCSRCHNKITGIEGDYIDKYLEKINGRKVYTRDANHVMQGKTYLREKLNEIANLSITLGSETATRRIEMGIDKSHSNDAIVITGVDVTREDCEIKNWTIKPMRRQSKAVNKEDRPFKHRDLVKYTKKDGTYYIGYIIAIHSNRNTCNIQTLGGKILNRYGLNRCTLIYRFNKIYWFDRGVSI